MHWISWSDPVKTRVLVQLLNQRVFRLNRLHHFCQLLVQYNLEFLQGSFLQFKINIKRQPIQTVKASQHSQVLPFYVYYLQDLSVFLKVTSQGTYFVPALPGLGLVTFDSLLFFWKSRSTVITLTLKTLQSSFQLLCLLPARRQGGEPLWLMILLGSLAPAMRLGTNMPRICMETWKCWIINLSSISSSSSSSMSTLNLFSLVVQ